MTNAQTRDIQLEEKIQRYSQTTTVTTTTVSVVRKQSSHKISKFFGYLIIGSHAIALCFFLVLWVFSYIPNTKNIVAAVMP